MSAPGQNPDESRLILWYRALLEGRFASAQYLEPDSLPKPRTADRNPGQKRSPKIISGELS